MLRWIRVILQGLIVVGIVGIISWFAFRKGSDIVINTTIPAIVQRLQSIKRLETAQMDIVKILEGEKEVSDTIPGTDLDEKVAKLFFEDTIRMEVYGQVIAGFDLSDIEAGDINLSTGTLSITLPEPIVLHTIVDDRTRVYDRGRGLLTKGDPQLESVVREQARIIIRDSALSEGILEEAKVGVSDALYSLLGDEIRIIILYQ